MKQHGKKAKIALKKAHTSLWNVIWMIKEENDYMDVLQQINAVQWLLKSATYHFLSEHVQEELTELWFEKKKQKKSLEKLVEEVWSIIKLAQKK